MAGLALSLSSCGDPNALTEDRISEVISEKVRLNPCIEFHGRGAMRGEAYQNGAPLDLWAYLESNELFPVTIRVGGFDEFGSLRYQEFEKVGLLTSRPDGGVPGAFGKTDELRRYDLTDLGRSMYQVWKEKAIEGPARNNALFCAGKGQISEIVNFVIPAEGQNSTTVSYRWNTVDGTGNPISVLPDNPWAGISGPRPVLEGEGTALLTLTNKGWVTD